MFDFIHGLLEPTPYDAYHIELKKKRSQVILVVEIEKAGYVNIEDCQIVSRLLEKEIENRDDLKEAFIEVASADPERELKTFKQYQNAVGKSVEIKLQSRIVRGMIQKVDENLLRIHGNNDEIEIIELSKIIIAKLTICF